MLVVFKGFTGRLHLTWRRCRTCTMWTNWIIDGLLAFNVFSPSFYMFILIPCGSLNQSRKLRLPPVPPTDTQLAANWAARRREGCSAPACLPCDEAPFHPGCQLESASAPAYPAPSTAPPPVWGSRRSMAFCIQ